MRSMFVMCLALIVAGCSIGHENAEVSRAEGVAATMGERRCVVHGAVGAHVCSYSFIEIILRKVPDGNVLFDGFFATVGGDRFIFMDEVSAVMGNYSQAIHVGSISDSVYESIPSAFEGKWVRVVGIYSSSSYGPPNSPFQTSGVIDVASIKYIEVK